MDESMNDNSPNANKRYKDVRGGELRSNASPLNWMEWEKKYYNCRHYNIEDVCRCI